MQSLLPVNLGREHLYSKKDDELSPKYLVKKAHVLPRHTRSTIIIDTDIRTFRENPSNTILLRPLDPEAADKDRSLHKLLRFRHLFRRMYERKRVKTPADLIEWLKRKHPEIQDDPYL